MFTPHLFPRPTTANQGELFSELLLVWAEAEAQPESDRHFNPSAPAPGKGVSTLLDRAARLDLAPTRAYHIRRANYLELLGAADAARRERELGATAPSQGSSRLLSNRHLLPETGTNCRRSFASDFATTRCILSPTIFGPAIFSRSANLRLGDYEQARDHLTSCLGAPNSFPDALPWLYILRGVAESQMNEFHAAEQDYVYALKLQPNHQAHYGILVNQGNLRLRQARFAQGLTSLPWSPVPFTSLDFACRGVVERPTSRTGSSRRPIICKKPCKLCSPDQYSAYGQYLALGAPNRTAAWMMPPSCSRPGDLPPMQPKTAVRSRPDSTVSARSAMYRQQKKPDAALARPGCGLACLRPRPKITSSAANFCIGRESRYHDAADAFAQQRCQWCSGRVSKLIVCWLRHSCLEAKPRLAIAAARISYLDQAAGSRRKYTVCGPGFAPRTSSTREPWMIITRH